MERMLARRVTRRNPFRVESVPLINRIYKYPFEKWSSPGKQALFGVANVGLFYAYQRFVPRAAKGVFQFMDRETLRKVAFDGRNTQFASLYFSMYAHGYEPEVTALLDVIVPDTGVFYDIGSNWGYLSLFVASKPGFRGKIHAFEPFPPTFADLQSVTQQAGVMDRVVLHNEAVADAPGETTMRIPDLLHSGWATMEEVSDKMSSREKRIKVISLDSLNIEPPSVIKIDAENAEARILSGGKRVLSQNRPMLVFENLKSLTEPQTTLEPFWILHDAGYRFYRPSWMKRIDSQTYFLGGDSHAAPAPDDTLTLLPFKPEERFLSYDQVNIFACHASEVPHLESLFPGV
jgi:FkbM family methyltransferase